MRRGENEGFLALRLTPPEEDALSLLAGLFVLWAKGRGFKFHPNTQGFHPNDRMAYPLYEVIAEHGIADASIRREGLGRFRVNLHHERGRPAATIRASRGTRESCARR